MAGSARELGCHSAPPSCLLAVLSLLLLLQIVIQQNLGCHLGFSETLTCSCCYKRGGGGRAGRMTWWIRVLLVQRTSVGS